MMNHVRVSDCTRFWVRMCPRRQLRRLPHRATKGDVVELFAMDSPTR